ncbi:hypothetical protein CHELA20_51263 [Hyphomicrobiales bacterium]|nr:hypothetical protein CHELA41_23749 [Hyphomicrobiales bacterium]CAH1674831.1 hypothetical protein CHELA20_51263 [Hyphomicrobiales bacterium]
MAVLLERIAGLTKPGLIVRDWPGRGRVGETRPPSLRMVQGYGWLHSQSLCRHDHRHVHRGDGGVRHRPCDAR